MDEDDDVLDDGAQRADEPREVRQEVLALERMEEDAGAVGRVAEQREDEEQQRQTLARALLLVLDDLRNARTEVADGADVPEDGCAERGLQLFPRAVILRRGHPDARLPGDGPPRCADGTHAEDAQRVLDPGVLVRLLYHQAGQAAGPSAAGARIPAAASAGVAPRQTDVGAVSATEQRLLDAVLTPGGLLAVLAGILDVVVHALGDEDQIREAEVNCERNHGGHELGPQRAGEVGDVAYEPDGEEGQRDAVCGGLAVVLDELGDLFGWSQRCDSRRWWCARDRVLESSSVCMFPASELHTEGCYRGCCSPTGRSTRQARRCRRHPTAPRGRSGRGRGR